VEYSYAKHESEMITNLRNRGDDFLELESPTEEVMQKLKI
jgi:hypothetical protein